MVLPLLLFIFLLNGSKDPLAVIVVPETLGRFWGILKLHLPPSKDFLPIQMTLPRIGFSGKVSNTRELEISPDPPKFSRLLR